MIVLKKGKPGQSYKIVLRAPLADVADLPSIRITDYEGEVLVESGLFEYDPKEWTTAEMAGRGAGTPKHLHLNTNGLPPTPGEYFLRHSNGQCERVFIVFVKENLATLAGNPTLSYPAGSVLFSASARYNFEACVTDEEHDFTANVLFCTDEGMVAYNVEGTVSESPAMCPVSTTDIYRIWPQLEVMMPVSTHLTDMEDKLDSVWDNVRSTLTSTGLKPEQFKAVSALKQVIIYEFAMILALGGIDPTGQKNPVDFRNMIEKTLKHKWDLLYTTKQFIDIAQTGKKGENQRGQGRLIEW